MYSKLEELGVIGPRCNSITARSLVLHRSGQFIALLPGHIRVREELVNFILEVVTNVRRHCDERW